MSNRDSNGMYKVKSANIKPGYCKQCHKPLTLNDYFLNNTLNNIDICLQCIKKNHKKLNK